jgi:hypothetical protein
MKITKVQLRKIIREAAAPIRPIWKIAEEISQLWSRVNFAAKPYLDAMFSLETIDDKYGLDSASSMIAYFLSNATSWRGPDAKRIKYELKQMIGQ